MPLKRREEAAEGESSGSVCFYRLAERGDLARPQLIARHRAHQDHGRAIAFSLDGRIVASAAEDILLWDAPTQKRIARFESSSIVWSLAFSPDGRWLVSTHADGAVLVWDVEARERIANLNEHSGAVRAVAFAPSGRCVASAGEDRSITFWDLESGRKEAVLRQHQTRVTAVAFSGDGRQLASSDQDGVVILWDIMKRRPRLMGRSPRQEPSYSVAISPDNRFVASSHALYSADGRMLFDFTKSWTQIYGAVFSADGRQLSCATDSGWILLWSVEPFRLIEAHQVPSTQQISIAWSPVNTIARYGSTRAGARCGAGGWIEWNRPLLRSPQTIDIRVD